MNVIPHFLLWKLGLAKPWTWYGSEEAQALETYGKGKKRLIEIGCWQGVNTKRLRSVMDAQGILFAVDPYPKGALGFNAAEIIAHHETEKISRGSLRWLKMSDLEASALFEKEKQAPLDLIFSDSLNSYDGFKETWGHWKKHLAAGGIYILANSHETDNKPMSRAGSVTFTREVVLKDPGFQLLGYAGCFTILKKIK